MPSIILVFLRYKNGSSAQDEWEAEGGVASVENGRAKGLGFAWPL